MRIKLLRAEKFRNIREMLFKPCEGVNVIYGENAQGKTNLLEAIWLFTGARSFRGARDSDYISFGEEKASLEVDFFGEGRQQSASIAYMVRKKSVGLNGVWQNGTTDLAGAFCAVVFSPDHLSIVKDGPEKRRRMIDASLCQAYPKYGKALAGYERSLRQRNRLLKDISLHASLLDTLDAWDAGIIEYGAYIIHMRARYLARLAEASAEIYKGISLGREIFAASYQPSFELGDGGFDRKNIRDCLERVLRSRRAADIKNRSTSAGPHRDDIVIMLDGSPARSFASQGQQRSCVLAIKLAECRILEERLGESPVVLLDDVMSELDASRRSYLLSKLTSRQVIITCCETSILSGIAEGEVFRISGGKIYE